MVAFKALFVSVILLLSLIATAFSAAAVTTVVDITRIGVESTPMQTVIFTSVEAAHDLTDAKVIVSIPGSDSRGRKNVDFGKDRKQTIVIALPASWSDDQYVKVVVTSDEGRRVVHRLLLP